LATNPTSAPNSGSTGLHSDVAGIAESGEAAVRSSSYIVVTGHYQVHWFSQRFRV